MLRNVSTILGRSLMSVVLAQSTLHAADSSQLRDVTIFLGGDTPSPEAILSGPTTTGAFGRDEIIHCVYWEFKPGGTNPKFGCFLAAANGSYLRNGALNYIREGVVRGDFYDSEGTLREGVQLDVVENRFVRDDGRAVSTFSPNLLKIKYNDTNVFRHRPTADLPTTIAARRQPPYRKARDMYTEVAATRLLWTLGYPVEPAYSTAAVVCHGCPEESAFEQEGRRRTMVYIDAMVDQKLPGAVELSDWNVRNIVRSVYPRQWSPVKRMHFDGLVVLAGLIHHKSNYHWQNSLVCVPGMGSECPPGSDTLMYIADLGSTFGAPHAKGQHSSWIEHPVWRDPSTCRVYLKWKDMSGSSAHLRITENGRQFILRRIRALTDDHLRAVFASARFEWVDGQLRLQKYIELFPELAAGEDIPRKLLRKPGLKDKELERLFVPLKRLEARLAPEQSERLSAAVIDQWVASFRSKAERLDTEVTNCRNTVRSRSRRRR